MNRGDVYYYYGPATAAGDRKNRRPVVIVSDDASNQQVNYPYITVVPITSNVDTIFPMEVDLNTYLPKLSKAQPQNIFTCRKDDLSEEREVALPSKIMNEIDTRLKMHLGLVK